jgi:hypothetical protein
MRHNKMEAQKLGKTHHEAHGQSAHGPRSKETNRLLLRPVQVKTLTRWRVDIGKGRHHLADL